MFRSVNVSGARLGVFSDMDFQPTDSVPSRPLGYELIDVLSLIILSISNLLVAIALLNWQATSERLRKVWGALSLSLQMACIPVACKSRLIHAWKHCPVIVWSWGRVANHEPWQHITSMVQGGTGGELAAFSFLHLSFFSSEARPLSGGDSSGGSERGHGSVRRGI